MPVRTMAIGAIVPGRTFVVGSRNSSFQGGQMFDQSELNSRAALCRQLAKREPANQIFWMAEAENWTLLSGK